VVLGLCVRVFNDLLSSSFTGWQKAHPAYRIGVHLLITLTAGGAGD
jgi:hypothetical protein